MLDQDVPSSKVLVSLQTWLLGRALEECGSWVFGLMARDHTAWCRAVPKFGLNLALKGFRSLGSLTWDLCLQGCEGVAGCRRLSRYLRFRWLRRSLSVGPRKLCLCQQGVGSVSLFGASDDSEPMSGASIFAHFWLDSTPGRPNSVS